MRPKGLPRVSLAFPSRILLQGFAATGFKGQKDGVGGYNKSITKVSRNKRVLPQSTRTG